MFTHGWPEVLVREQLVHLITSQVFGYWCIVVCADEMEMEIWVLGYLEMSVVEETSVGFTAICQ